MKSVSKLQLFFTPTDSKDAVNKEYVDSMLSGTTGLGGNSSTYLGEIELINGIINITCDSLNISSINNHTILILKSSTSSSSKTPYSENVKYNSTSTSYKILDKYYNNLRLLDIITGGVIELYFNGNNFILLNKEYLIDSYNSNSIINAPTAKALKETYDYFDSLIGDIPSVLDRINRKEV